VNPEQIEAHLVTKQSVASGYWHTRTLLLSKEQWGEIQPFLSGTQHEAHSRKIQEILPFHSAEDREFLLSGTTPEEWAALFGLPEDTE
jgi:hypothetical protein